MMGVVVAQREMGIEVQARGPETGTFNAHPGHRVQTEVVPCIDLGQQLSSQVLRQWRELRVKDYVVQLFGQQFSVQVDVGAVPKAERQSQFEVKMLSMCVS